VKKKIDFAVNNYEKCKKVNCQRVTTLKTCWLQVSCNEANRKIMVLLGTIFTWTFKVRSILWWFS